MNLISVLIFILCLTMFATTQAFQRLAKQQGVSGVWSSTSRLMATDRTYVGYSIYKGKGALNVKPLPPTFNKVGKSGRGIEREGSLYLEFAPIGSKPREYNWASKVTFSLDVNECGGILAMDRSLGVEFLHDPNMGGNDAGKVTKKLKIVPTQDGKGLFVSIQVNDRVQNVNTMLSVPVTWGEMEVIRTTAQFCIPRFLGFDQVFEESSAPASAPSYGNSYNNEPEAPSPMWK